MRHNAPFARSKAMFAVLAAAFAITAPVERMLALQGVGAYKSRGKGRGTPSRRYGRGGSWPKAHQSGQECLRRALGGWAFRQRLTGMTKLETLRFLAPKQKMRLETAIATVRGLSMKEAA